MISSSRDKVSEQTNRACAERGYLKILLELLSPVQKLSKVTLILGFDPELSVLQYPLPLSLYQTPAVESSANILHRNREDPSLSYVGMGTETRYLIGLGAKLWKTEVSISSDVNGSAIGTGEIKKTHLHLLLLHIHIILQILSHQSRLLFLYRLILKHLSMMHFCYSQFRSEIALTWRSFSARNMKAV